MADTSQSSPVADTAPAASEEGPDSDVDVSATDGTRAAKRTRDTLYESMERQAAEQERRFRGPDKAYGISKELYDKAEKANDTLTEEERTLLLSQGDVVGKALARPDSLSLEERYAVLQWSPPDELHAAIRKATDSALSTPEELYAAARQGNSADLSPDVKRILASKFWVDAATKNDWSRWFWNEVPGNWQALTLLYQRSGIDVNYLAFASISTSHASASLSSTTHLAPNQTNRDRGPRSRSW